MTNISWLDVKLAVRMMTKHPAVTLVGGLGIAVGMAISVGFFSFGRTYAFPDLPLSEGDRVVALENRDIAIDNEERRSLHDFFAWRDELQTVQDLTAFRTLERNLIIGGVTPEVVQVAEMTASGFRLARVAPFRGRYFTEEEEREGAERVLVIGYDVWQRLFDGDAAVVGRTVRLGGVVHTVIGVMPDGFEFPESHDYWTPLRVRPEGFDRRAGPGIFIAGRLAPGVTMPMAQAELSGIGERTTMAHPRTHAQLRPMIMPYTHSLTDMQGMKLWQLIQMNLMVSLLLVVVALNVAVLTYARTAARQGEIAMRNALGASRWRIVAQLFVESFVVAVIAAGVGLALAQVGLSLANRIIMIEFDYGVPFWMDFGFRPMTVLFAVLLAIFTAVITGILPALQATGRRLQAGLRELSGGTRMRLGRTWTALIIAQIAIAVAALPAAVNMGWTQIRSGASRATYPAEEFIIGSLVAENVPASAPTDLDAGRRLTAAYGNRLTELKRRLETEPAVAGVTFAASRFGRDARFRVEGRAVPPQYRGGHPVTAFAVHPDYPQVFGLRIVTGRAFVPADLNEDTGVLVTEAFVKQVLNGEAAVGRRIRMVSEAELAGRADTTQIRWREIVGVVQDQHTNRFAPEQIRPEVLFPARAEMFLGAAVIVRLRGTGMSEFVPRYRQIVAEVDPSLRLGTISSLADRDRQQQLAARLTGLAIGLILVSVLLLSAAGIYAMMSFTVTQRRREIGIRVALGAHPRQLLLNIFSRASAQIATGVLVGVLIGALVEQATGGEVLGGRGAVLLPALAVIMTIVGLLAALGPARRGLRIQPTEALRADG